MAQDSSFAPPLQVGTATGDGQRSRQQREWQEGEENKGMALILMLLRHLRATGQLL